MKKKKGLKRFNLFNISNKLGYTLIVILTIVLLGIGVYALTPGVAPNPGHTLASVAPPSPCSSGQVIIWDGDHLVCSNGVALYQCPGPSVIATHYCTNVQLFRNGVEPCMGQFTTNPGTGCYQVDVNCNFDPINGIGSWGSCSTLVGHLMP